MIGSNLLAVTRFIGAARLAEIPEAVMEMARRCLVDWVASAAAALTSAEAKALEAYVSGWRSQGSAMSLFGASMAAAPAALVNGAIAHLLDYDDVNLATAFHPGAPTFAACVAVAMDRGLSEAELLRAFVVGYEVGAAFGADGAGLALVDRGWHPTAILGHLSAAAASAYLLRLDATAISHTFGLVVTQAGGLLAAGGSAAKPFHVGKAAMDGVMAAEAAEAGLDGHGDLLDDGKPGLFHALIGRTQPIHGLGETWRILETGFKAYPCCQFAHAPLEAARQLAPNRPDSIRGVRVFANPVSRQVAGHMRPRNATEARFSIAYAAALGLTGRRGTPDDFTEARLAEPDVQRVMEKVELVTDPSIERWSSKIELVLEADEVREAMVLDPLGSAGCPMGWSNLRGKFDDATRPRFGPRADALFAELAEFGSAQPASRWFRSAFTA